MKSFVLSTLLLSTLAYAQQASRSSARPSASASANPLYPEYGVLEFDNFGFEGYFRNVATLDDSKDCKCELATNDKRTLFSGPNSPLDEGVSVHFRGPLVLHNFAFYDSEHFELGSSSSSNWTRRSFYNGNAKDNATFLGTVGDASTCLGNALSYVDSDGVTAAKADTLLGENTLIKSDDEFILFSNISCQDSGFDKDCGVYRKGIPAYHGFTGTTKLFLFEFEMPEETSTDEEAFEFYNMPAIWLLNDHIPRTAQYPTNENCSCWATGCGEFDIFEIMNTTEATHLYSTIHDYQGTGDIGTGIQAPGYIERSTSSVMKGGVVFGSDGRATVFMSDDVTFDSSLAASEIISWVSDTTNAESAVTDPLPSATNTGTGSTTNGSPSSFNVDLRIVFASLAIFGTSLLF